MNNINSTSRLMELMPQPAVIVDIQSNEIIMSNRAAKSFFSIDNHTATQNMDTFIIHTPSTVAVAEAVQKKLQAYGESVLNHIHIKNKVNEAGRYDIHISYVDDTHKSVYLIFANSAHELQRMAHEHSYYSTIADAAYSYPFHLDIKTRRMEFFDPSFERNYHMPLLMENFPESVFQYNYLYEEDIDAYKQTVDRMYKGESPEGSFRFYDVNGELLRYSVDYVVNRDTAGQPIEINGDFIMQSSAQHALEYKEKLQKTVHECVDILFTAGSTNQDPKVAYTAILNKVKEYYHAEGTYFYKFIEETRKVERVHIAFDDNLKDLELSLPEVINEDELNLMQLLTESQLPNLHDKLDSFPESYKAALMQQQELYHIEKFSCVAIKNALGETIAFLGIINARNYPDNKNLIESLSRPICMFIESQREQRMEQELLKLEATSKADVVKECVENFREFTHCKEHISTVLESLCSHYDADCAVTLTSDNDNNGDYSISHIGGPVIPSFDDLQCQPAKAMEKWEQIFKKHKHFITDSELDNPEAKKLLKEKFGVYNFIAAPIQDHRGVLTGLLYVMNYKALKRSNLLTHIVANNIATYLDKIALYTEKHLEPLTKLADKVATQNQISEHLEDGTKGALFIIDIDYFKELNDNLGHQIGDQAIITFADIIRNNFRSTDVVGRVGGDEFMVFCPHLTADDLIHQIAKRLLEKCNLRYEKDGVTAEITASIGICRVDHNLNTFQSLYEKADKVLYLAKTNGKNQYHIYTPTPKEQ